MTHFYDFMMTFHAKMVIYPFASFRRKRSWYSTIQWSTVLYNTVKYSTIQYCNVLYVFFKTPQLPSMVVLVFFRTHHFHVDVCCLSFYPGAITQKNVCAEFASFIRLRAAKISFRTLLLVRRRPFEDIILIRPSNQPKSTTTVNLHERFISNNDLVRWTRRTTTTLPLLIYIVIIFLLTKSTRVFTMKIAILASWILATGMSFGFAVCWHLREWQLLRHDNNNDKVHRRSSYWLVTHP
jgi:hypothetical protein